MGNDPKVKVNQVQTRGGRGVSIRLRQSLFNLSPTSNLSHLKGLFKSLISPFYPLSRSQADVSEAISLWCRGKVGGGAVRADLGHLEVSYG